MIEHEEQLEALSEMRDLMKRSSRFLSLSGLSGICAGVFALAGAAAAYFVMGGLFYDLPLQLRDILYDARSVSFIQLLHGAVLAGVLRFVFYDAFAVLMLSLAAGWFFSKRKAKRESIPFWDDTAWRALINLVIPLAAGGLFCFGLLYHGVIGLIAPATLIFYGLALVNAGKYTLNDIRYLGLSEIGLGLISLMFIGYGLIFWTIGFGLLHIVYGAVMYYKYER